MFKTARLKLTGWYLLIIMSVSLAFSFVIYRSASMELRRFAEAQRARFERRVVVQGIPTEFRMSPTFIIDDQLVDDARHRIMLSLSFINLGILGLASFLGYYLSGKTLAPIQEMVDEQYRFVSDASHELKTPITAMKSTLEVSLRDTKMNLKEAKNTLKVSLEEVNNLQKLAEGLLELTTKHNKLQMTPIKLDLAVSDAMKMLEPLSRQRGVNVKSMLAKVRILGEYETLKRAIVTVLDNAIKYSPANNTVHVSLKIIGKQVVLNIKDQGIGISKEDLPKIFNRFYRSDKARSSGGHGLGLAIAKQIVKAHAGKIVVQSKLHKGTQVVITFPYSAQIQKQV